MARLPALSLKLDPAQLTAQFQGLNGRHPGLWPSLPRVLVMSVLFTVIVAIGWGVYWRSLFDDLDLGQQREQQLKAQFADKLKQAVNLPALVRQKEQVLHHVKQLEKQLPSRAEMDALLSDINQAGVGRGAQLQSFKPGQVVVKDYYAELPIAVRVVGNYHDLGAFVSDIANLPRIVTLNSLSIQPLDKGGVLAMDATARTFRYLDGEEIAQQKTAGAKRKPTEVRK